MKQTKIFAVTGMACQHCRAHVEEALTNLNGVESATANVAEKNVTVTYDDDQVNITEMQTAVSEAGYTMGDEA